MTKMVSLATFGVVLVACSTTTTSEGSGCPDIVGNYTATAERISGTCDPALDAKSGSFGVTKAGDGYLVVLPGIENGCPASYDVNTCKLTSACELRDENQEVIVTTSVEFTFTARGYTGSSVNGLRPPVVATTCSATYRETGTKL